MSNKTGGALCKKTKKEGAEKKIKSLPATNNFLFFFTINNYLQGIFFTVQLIFQNISTEGSLPTYQLQPTIQFQSIILSVVRRSMCFDLFFLIL